MSEVLKQRPGGRLSVPEGLAPHTQASLIATKAVARGIEVTRLPRRRLELRHGELSHRFRSGWSTLNSPLAWRCTRQKEVSSRLLREQGFPAPENTLFRDSDVNRAWSWAESVLPVVIKPNAASKGTLVHVGVASREDFINAFSRVAAQYGQVLVEEFVPGDEHRFAVVDNQVVAITRRVPPRVVADGAMTVSALIDIKNRERRARNNPLHRRPIAIDDAVLDTVKSQGLTLESVPPAAAVVWLRRTSNISIGGEAVDRTDAVPRSIVELIERATRAIPGLRMAGYDVLVPPEEGGPPTIIEINPSPMLSMHIYPWEGSPREVFDRVLDAMFPATADHRYG